MEFIIFGISIILTLGLSFLSYQDRLFGIAGVIIGFISMAFAGNDNSITVRATWDGSVWQNQTIAFQPYIFMVYFVIIVIGIVCLYDASEKLGGISEEERQGMLDESWLSE